MATATAVSVIRNERVQFQGLFEQVVVVEFTVDPDSITGNTNDETTISAPGIDHETDFVLGWTHTHSGVHAHEVTEEFHTWDDALHLVIHNMSGSPINLPSTTYRVVVARLIR